MYWPATRGTHQAAFARYSVRVCDRFVALSATPCMQARAARPLEQCRTEGAFLTTPARPFRSGTATAACSRVPDVVAVPDLSALSASQKLTSQFPTYEVFPYYYSGSTFIVKGQTRKRLIPMPTFGIHAFHTGNFYGWSRTLLDSAGNALAEVFPNVFKISVSKASGLARRSRSRSYSTTTAKSW